MPYFFKIAESFKKKLRRFKKKFPSLKEDVIECLRNFEKYSGNSLGENNFKVRFKCRDLKRGKNKSFRIIIHIKNEKLIFPISIYFKSDRSAISKKEINDDLALTVAELEFSEKQQLFRTITLKNRHEETDTGHPMGREVW